ncbi:MAG: tetratricopeptide repeat protein [Pirellulales bacterium]
MKDIRSGLLLAALVIAITVAGRAAPRLAADEAPQNPIRLETKHISDDNRVRLEVGPGRGNTLKVVPFQEDEEPAAALPAKRGGSAAANAAPARRPVAHPAIDTGGQDLPADNAEAEGGAVQADGVEPVAGAESDSDIVIQPPRRTRPPQAVQRLPATTLEPKANFQPRFRTPGVRHAQHLEPATEAVGAVNENQATETAADDPSAAQDPDPAAAAAAAAGATTAPATASTAASTAAPGKALLEAAYAKSKTAATDSDYSTIIDLCRRANDEGLKTNHAQYARQLMSWAYNRRGEARVGEAREQEALADFEASAELNPQSWRAVHNRGVSYASMNRVDEAIADFERTIALNPKYANAHFNLGELRYQQGKFEEAIGHYTAAIDLGPPDAAMFSSRGHAFYRLRRFGDALREYSRALQIDPQHAPALVNRGDAYLDVGRYADAAADYRAAIDADPNLGRAYQAAAWLMATCPDEHYRNNELALEAANKAVELDGDNHRTLETLAAAQANSGMFTEAKESQERAIAAVPRDQLVAAEKRMALYQRDLAYREVSRQEMVAGGERRKQAAAEGKLDEVQQATAELPVEDPGHASFPEAQLTEPAAERGAPAGRGGNAAPYADAIGAEPPTTSPKRSFWPPQLNPSNLNPFDKSGEPTGEQQPQRRPRTLPKKPNRPSNANPIRPW